MVFHAHDMAMLHSMQHAARHEMVLSEQDSTPGRAPQDVAPACMMLEVLRHDLQSPCTVYLLRVTFLGIGAQSGW